VPIDPETFKEVLRRWTSGVTVVTCRRSGRGVHGMTASSFTSVSLDPPLVLVCVDRRTRTHEYVLAEEAFGIHILGTEMEDVANRCAGFLGEAAHELDDLPSRVEVTGAPILNGTVAWMDCSLWRAYEGGDHTIFVGELRAAGPGDGRPLLWFDRDYRHLRE
jgi:flavin reductase (DIM6/NTAB) family NADH-FMN oxidoreductase RutF